MPDKAARPESWKRGDWCNQAGDSPRHTGPQARAEEGGKQGDSPAACYQSRRAARRAEQGCTPGGGEEKTGRLAREAGSTPRRTGPHARTKGRGKSSETLLLTMQFTEVAGSALEADNNRIYAASHTRPTGRGL
eukprot:4706967-Amphidinium_carterae.1